MSGTLLGETIYSASNRRRFEHWTWLPDGEGPFPLLVLLHGVYDAGGFVWWAQGGASETLDRLVGGGEIPPMVVVMAGDTGAELGSGYCDWADGTTSAETYIIDELLPWVTQKHPVTDERWITGLSMGGYGAFLLALRHPGTFQSASATSGFFDPSRLFDFVPNAATRMWGDGAGMAAHDVFALIADEERRGGTRFALDCGTGDLLIEENRRMQAHLEGLGVCHGYAEHPGGHEWPYWATHLEDHLRFHTGSGGVLCR